MLYEKAKEVDGQFVNVDYGGNPYLRRIKMYNTVVAYYIIDHDYTGQNKQVFTDVFSKISSIKIA